jgi:hypothetical protein
MNEKRKAGDIIVTAYNRGNKYVCNFDYEHIKSNLNGQEFNTTEIPCVRCGKMPTEDGHDQCLGTLPGVVAACCGHGVEEGYILFENGIIIRGNFVIEKIVKNNHFTG